MLKQILSNKQTYLVLATFITAGLTAILPQTEGTVSIIISAILGILSMVNHQTTVTGQAEKSYNAGMAIGAAEQPRD